MEKSVYKKLLDFEDSTYINYLIMSLFSNSILKDLFRKTIIKNKPLPKIINENGDYKRIRPKGIKRG